MGVSVENASSGGKGPRSVDLEMNLVPFIDMMTVLVAFLLITAVWTEIGRIDVTTGAGKGGEEDEHTAKTLSVLIANDGVWLGVPELAARRVPHAGEALDSTALDVALGEFALARLVASSTTVEIAADDTVPYQDVVTTMDRLVGRDLRAIRYTDPASLSVRFAR